MLLLFKRLNNPILPLLSYQLSNSSKKQTKIKLKAQTPASSLNARKAFKHDFTECINSIPTTIVFVCVVLPIVDERQLSHREETEALQLGEERCHVNSVPGNTITGDTELHQTRSLQNM